MTHGRHRKRDHPLIPLAIAAAAVAVLAGVAWLTGVGSGGRSGDQDTATQDAAASVLAQASDDCRNARQLVTEDFVAMGGAMQQWRIHVDAMTDLVAGRIDLAQASAFWNSTRVEGRRSLALWHRLDKRYRDADRNCAAPTTSSGSDERALNDCRQRQQAADKVLGVARHTLGDWGTHIAHMDALRAGKISPGHALHLWDTMYKRGKADLRAYDKAYTAHDRAPACALH